MPLDRFFTIGMVAYQHTHRVFLAGSNDFGETLLTIALPVCSSDVTTTNDLKNEVVGLTSSSGTINVLSSNLDNVQTALNNGNNKNARNRMSNFIDRVVNRSNYADTNPDRILLPEANQLLCGASNVLIAIPLQ